jgi:two-component system, response regulator PdtaR
MSRLRILLVEDEPMIALLLTDLLAEMGHEICAIESTETGAIAAAVRCKPGLLIVDASLREGSGVAAVEEILSAGFIPHLFISGETASVQARMPGAVVLQKPFREPDLARAITTLSDKMYCLYLRYESRVTQNFASCRNGLMAKHGLLRGSHLDCANLALSLMHGPARRRRRAAEKKKNRPNEVCFAVT